MWSRDRCSVTRSRPRGIMSGCAWGVPWSTWIRTSPRRLSAQNLSLRQSSSADLAAPSPSIPDGVHLIIFLLIAFLLFAFAPRAGAQGEPKETSKDIGDTSLEELGQIQFMALQDRQRQADPSCSGRPPRPMKSRNMASALWLTFWKARAASISAMTAITVSSACAASGDWETGTAASWYWSDWTPHQQQRPGRGHGGHGSSPGGCGFDRSRGNHSRTQFLSTATMPFSPSST